MRHTIRDLISIIEATLPIREPVFEFGSLQVEGQEGFADLRPLFPGREYVGADMREGPGVDRLLDLHGLDLPSASVGTALCLDTLEHVAHPHRAVEEIHRVLEPGGMAVLSSVMNFPIHEYPQDFWRFTPQAFRLLLSPFPQCFTGYAGEALFPHTVIGIGFKGPAPQLGEFERQFGEWRDSQVPREPERWKRIAKLLIPPVFLPVIRRIRNAGGPAPG